MGESKRRGSREERIAQSLGLEQQKLDDLIKKLGLPENAEFCGYLIHVVDRDEFIHEIDDTPHLTNRIFVKTPELAFRFDDFWEAHKYTRLDKGEIIVGLFDVGDQLIIHNVL
jgi:hypothetical protein